MTTWARANGWLFGQESAARLRVVHTGLTVLVLLRVALPPYRGLAGQPAALFDPPWFLVALPGMPPLAAIVSLQVVGSAAALRSLVARPAVRRGAFALAWVCLLVLAGLRASRGKIMHNDLLLILACVPFLAAPRHAAAGDLRPSDRYGWPVRAAMVVIAVAYFRAGLGKLAASGLAWVASDNMRWILFESTRREPPKAPTDAVALFVVDRPWLATATAGALLAFELSALLVLFRPGYRLAFAAGALVLHAGTWLTIGLDYWTWAAVVPLVVVDWPALVARGWRGGRGQDVVQPGVLEVPHGTGTAR